MSLFYFIQEIMYSLLITTFSISSLYLVILDPKTFLWRFNNIADIDAFTSSNSFSLSDKSVPLYSFLIILYTFVMSPLHKL